MSQSQFSIDPTVNYSKVRRRLWMNAICLQRSLSRSKGEQDHSKDGLLSYPSCEKSNCQRECRRQYHSYGPDARRSEKKRGGEDCVVRLNRLSRLMSALRPEVLKQCQKYSWTSSGCNFFSHERCRRPITTTLISLALLAKDLLVSASTRTSCMTQPG